jgi:hypothetical protein
MFKHFAKKVLLSCEPYRHKMAQKFAKKVNIVLKYQIINGKIEFLDIFGIL